jgi:outer membrane protein, heavy metal efflux system
MDRGSLIVRRFASLGLLLGAVASAGCRTSGVVQQSAGVNVPRATARSNTSPRPATGTVEPADVADKESRSEQQPSEIRQVAAREEVEHVPGVSSTLSVPMSLTVRQAIETALAQNPDLVALRQAEGVSAAAVGVAETYPFNPFVQVQATPYQNTPSGGTGTTYHYVLLMQQIQLAHQQRFREEAAGAALNSVRWSLLQAELTNVAQTQRLYFTALYLRGLRDLAELNAKNNREFLTILERQVEGGQASAADAAMVRLDARATRQQFQLAEANYQTALLDLRRQLGLPHDAPIVLDDAVLQFDWSPASGEQLATMAESRPDVMAARADVDAARAGTGLADATRTPDLQIGPYYQRTLDGSNFLGFRAQMDIPVLNNGMPLLRQREAEQNQRTMTWQQLQTRAKLEAQAAADRYERARQLVADISIRDRSDLPVELQQLETQFKANEVDVLRVVQARNSLIQSRRADLDSLNELLQAAATVTAASGLPLESLTVPNDVPLKTPSITE